MEPDTLSEILSINELLLRIGISQKTVFDWLNFNSYGIVTPNYVRAWYGSSSEPLFTSATYDLLLHTFYEKIRYGLLIGDLNNIIIFILGVRFFLLLFRFNVVTSFVIVSISFIAGIWWYVHLRHVFILNYKILQGFPVFRSIVWSFDEVLVNKDMDARYETSAFELFKHYWTRLWYECTAGELYIYKKTLETAFYRSYLAPFEPRFDNEVSIYHFHLDPVALFINLWRMYDIPCSSFLMDAYYLCTRYLNDKIINEWFPFIWTDVSDTIMYTIVVRMGRKYCPYLIRWHFTYVAIHRTVESLIFPLWFRAYTHLNWNIIPAYEAGLQREENFYQFNPKIKAQDIAALTPDHAKVYLFYVLMLQFTVIAMFIFNLYGMLHAFSGQYFYVPFFTENVELNVGPRTPESIYSGGSTAWQDKDMNTSYQFWFGWFGRGTDKPSIITLLFILLKWIVIKILEILRLKQVFLRFFKFLKNKFKKK